MWWVDEANGELRLDLDADAASKDGSKAGIADRVGRRTDVEITHPPLADDLRVATIPTLDGEERLRQALAVEADTNAALKAEESDEHTHAVAADRVLVGGGIVVEDDEHAEELGEVSLRPMEHKEQRSRLTPPSSATEAGHARRRIQKPADRQPLSAGARG